ncbi:MAG: hypothetical protein EAZ89_10380 [Bacteroidetes bacterium]|nr:MAG: hypothetical protein EAZ89_10380 [Bacteroidota bacterium]
MRRFVFLLTLLSFLYSGLPAQSPERFFVPAEVDFSRRLRDWQGFGFTYTEALSTPDYSKKPQDYGGFQLLNERKRQQVLQMIFGEEGLKVSFLKVYLDPFHQAVQGGTFDHSSSTANLRYIAREGQRITRGRMGDFSIYTVLFAPPGWMTLQKQVRGRDLDPVYKPDLQLYITDWLRYLRDQEGLTLRGFSLHEGGEDWSRWDEDGLSDKPYPYSMYWSPELTTEFVRSLQPVFKTAGLQEVLISAGEPQSWQHFNRWGYADALLQDEKTFRALGFIAAGGGEGTAAPLLEKRPELPAWSCAGEWGAMDVTFVQSIQEQIYVAQVSAYAPRTGIYRPSQWAGSPKEASAAFLVREDSTYEVLRGYHYYKQVSRAGQAGMIVAAASAQSDELSLMAFGSNKTRHPDAFALINTGVNNPEKADAVEVEVGRHRYHFNLTDPELRFNYANAWSLEKQRLTGADAGVKSARTCTEKGYLLEVAIPKSRFMEAWEVNAPFSVRIADQDYLHSEIARDTASHNLCFSFRDTLCGSHRLLVPGIESPVMIDGNIDPVWQGKPVNALQSRSGWLSAGWKAIQDDRYLYLLFEVHDSSPLPGRLVSIAVKGSTFTRFEAWRSTDGGEQYRKAGIYDVQEGKIEYSSPARSVTTFFGIK